MTTLIDPRVARVVARRFAGHSPLQDSHLLEGLMRELDEAVPLSEELVAQEAGIPTPDPVRWDVIDRDQWVRANIAGMSELIKPLADRVGPRLEAAPWAIRTAQKSVVSAEVGALLGYVSRRVLGQYDLIVPETAPSATVAAPTRSGRTRNNASLYFVGVNIVETERRLGFIPRDFALWVSLHEVTHRFQFAGVPWLRERFFGLVHSYLEAMDLDARGLARRFASAATRLVSRATPPEERNPVYLFASPEQRGTLDDIQALMTVVEGHGNYVMDAVGAKVIPSFRRMRSVFQRRRRQTTAVQRALNHAIGLEMKLRQYELGQAFCEAIVGHAGPPILEVLWAAPDNLPGLKELKDPDSWLARVA